MHHVLADMIARFRDAQDRAVGVLVGVLADTLGIRVPTSNREWVTICAECGLYNTRRVNGIEVYAHGFGIELVLDGVTIDFDWGDAGEPDGFDAWRLWNFIRVNELPVACDSYAQVRSWLEEAAASGELTRDQLLYYSPAHRARFQEPNKVLQQTGHATRAQGGPPPNPREPAADASDIPHGYIRVFFTGSQLKGG